MRFQITLELIETILETPAQGIADLTNKLIEGNYSELSLSGVLVGQINEEEDEIEEVDIIQLFTHVTTILQQTKISHLDVSFNMLTKEALLHIINSIKTGTHLTSINLGFNSIDPNTAEELTAALKNHDIVQISGFDNSKGMANTVLKKAMTVFESLLTSAPTHAQQILEALFNLQQEQMILPRFNRHPYAAIFR